MLQPVMGIRRRLLERRSAGWNDGDVRDECDERVSGGTRVVDRGVERGAPCCCEQPCDREAGRVGTRGDEALDAVALSWLQGNHANRIETQASQYKASKEQNRGGVRDRKQEKIASEYHLPAIR